MSITRSNQKAEGKMATQMNLKLLIDTRSRKVLFAEAGKDVVDFLFSLLSMPIGSIVKLLAKEHMAGSVSSIYKSVECIDETYLETNQTKSRILNPTFVSPSKTLFLTGSSSTSTGEKYYTCSGGSYMDCSSYYTDTPSTGCPKCNYQMNLELAYVGPKSEAVVKDAMHAGGFVKGVVTYTIMDDLSVMPMSTISSIALLNKFNVRDATLLEERTVKLGMKEGLGLLKASLQSKTVLTDVFVGTKPGKRAKNVG